MTASIVLALGRGWLHAQPPVPPAESPTIRILPALSDLDNEVVEPGGSGRFAVSTASTPRRTRLYQWRKDGLPIPGATSSVFEFDNAQLSDAGEYTVSVTTVEGGYALEGPATLTVNEAVVAPAPETTAGWESFTNCC